MKNKKRKIPVELWMLLPTIVILGAITVFPFVYMVRASFMEFSFLPGIPNKFIGAGNWLEMFHDPAIGRSWIVTLKYYGGALFFELLLGVVIALLLGRLARTRDLIATFILVPMFLAPVLVGLLWRFLLHDSYGVYAYIIRELGLFKDISFFGDVRTAFPIVVIMDIWEWTPLIVIIILAGLAALPNELLEASSIDGASYWQQLIYIVFPLLKPFILVALLIRTMDLVRFYAKIMITTGGGPADTTKILAIRIFENAFRFFRLGYASTIALTLLAVTIGIGLLFVDYLFKGEED